VVVTEPNPPEEIRYIKAYQQWTAAEDALLKQKFSGGANIEELAAFFQRRPSAIRSRLKIERI
jgi:hypothetical protein